MEGYKESDAGVINKIIKNLDPASKYRAGREGRGKDCGAVRDSDAGPAARGIPWETPACICFPPKQIVLLFRV